MITTLIFDFSRVLLFPIDTNYSNSLNNLHDNLKQSLKEYNLLNHFQINQELLDYLKNLKTKYQLYIFTTGQIQNEPELKKDLDKVFEAIFTVEDIGEGKNSPNTYTKLLEKIGKKPEETIYIDNTKENLNQAQKAGIITIHYQNNQKLYKELNKLGIST